MKILDLHGIKHRNVESVCHEFINNNWGNDLKIITGYSSYMKKLVYTILAAYDVEILNKSENFPYIRIRG